MNVRKAILSMSILIVLMALVGAAGCSSENPSSDGAGEPQTSTESELALRCPVGIAEGESFPSSVDCGRCICLHGRVICTARMCPRGCEYDDKFYPVGASFPSTDGCNTCTCLAFDRVVCSERPCRPPVDAAAE